jgi:hypothetical protein
LIAKQQVARQQVVEFLRAAGLPEVADEGNRSLPDQLDLERAARFLQGYGITRDVLISRMGGSIGELTYYPNVAAGMCFANDGGPSLTERQ